MSLATIALRAYAERVERKEGKSVRRLHESDRPRHVLLFDLATSNGTAEHLLFGGYRYLSLLWGEGACRVMVREEGLFCADDVAQCDPETMGALEYYARTHPLDVERGLPDRLRLFAAREFLDRQFLRAAYRDRAWVTGFGLPRLLSLLAVKATAARGPFKGGFSLVMWQRKEESGAWVENKFRPRIDIKAIDSNRQLIGFTRRNEPDSADLIPEGSLDGKPVKGSKYAGHFLDLKTLSFALTNESHSLPFACDTFGVPCGQPVEHHVVSEEAIDALRNRLKAQTRLLEAMLDEFYRYRIGLAPDKAFSPASIGKAHLDAMGIRPILERQPDFPKHVLGAAMNAFYGGRAETRIRSQIVPVVYTDVLSMYPTVNTLTGLWPFLTCERIEVSEDTEAVRAFLEGATFEQCLNPKTWKSFNVLVQVAPDGEPYPSRTRDPIGKGFQIGVNPLTSAEPLWYALPDVIAAKLSSGRTPKVLQAIRLIAHETDSLLTAIFLRGRVWIDPANTDLFPATIEERMRSKRREDVSATERKRLSSFLKVFANATSYGVFAEFNRDESGGKQRVRVWRGSGETFETTVSAAEDPGRFAFPPLAAITTASARLMLCLIELSVREAGGTFAMCDTDSLAIVATERGGLLPCPAGSEKTHRGQEAVRALSWDQVEAIRTTFERLNPYDKAVVPGSILKLEDENLDPVTGKRRQLYCYSISAKRYALFNVGRKGGVEIRKASGHGLGYLRAPIGADAGCAWLDEAWVYIVTADGLKREAKPPEWFGEPALTPVPLSSFHVLRAFARHNAGKPYAEQVKAFGTLLTATIADLGRPVGVGPGPFQLIAPDGVDALTQPWTDLHSGNIYRVSATAEFGGRGIARIQTHGDVLERYRVHPESGTVGPHDRPSTGETVGLLSREPRTVCRVLYVGKESNRLEEVQAGMVDDANQVFTVYNDPKDDSVWRAVVSVLRTTPREAIIAASKLSPRAIRDILAHRAIPRRDSRNALEQLAITHAREELKKRGLEAPKEMAAALFELFEAQQ